MSFCGNESSYQDHETSKDLYENYYGCHAKIS